MSTASALVLFILSAYMFEPNKTKQIEQPVQQEVYTDKEIAPAVAKMEIVLHVNSCTVYSTQEF